MTLLSNHIYIGDEIPTIQRIILNSGYQRGPDSFLMLASTISVPEQYRQKLHGRRQMTWHVYCNPVVSIHRKYEKEETCAASSVFTMDMPPPPHQFPQIPPDDDLLFPSSERSIFSFDLPPLGNFPMYNDDHDIRRLDDRDDDFGKLDRFLDHNNDDDQSKLFGD
jgi:hypothetical protein